MIGDTSWRPREEMQFEFRGSLLVDQEELIKQKKYKGVRWTECLVGEGQLFLLVRPLTYWLRLTHSLEVILLYSKCTYVNIYLFQESSLYPEQCFTESLGTIAIHN